MNGIPSISDPNALPTNGNGVAPSSIGGGVGSVGGVGTAVPNVDAPESPRITDVDVDQEALYATLMRRGRSGGPGEIKLSKNEEDQLCQYIENDFNDTESSMRPFKQNMLEMLKNWRGTKDNKDFPFEGASNIRVPLTSSYVETMKAREIKAIFGGDKISEISKIDEEVDQEALAEMNDWFHWEMIEVIKLKNHFENIIHNKLITGIGLSVPTYHHETRFLHSRREWEPGDEANLSDLLESGLQEILAERSEWGKDVPIIVEKQTKLGVFKLNDGGQIIFSLNEDDSSKALTLVADVWRRETIFDGVREHCVNLEDLAIINSGETVDDLPFLGIRQFVDVQKYRERLDDKYFIDYGSAENERIIGHADTKHSVYIGREQSDQQDAESGTDSTDANSSNTNRKYLEVYRWEGWWARTDKSEDPFQEKLLVPASQFAVWMAPAAKRVIRIQRLEDLNKDAKRSAIKYDFIREPGRFLSLGLAEWVKNSQIEMDAIHNQRLDAGLLTNVPFGFYKPTAGFKGQVIKIEPGKLFPVADPQGVNFPQTNWRPTFSFQEEALVKRYAGEQAGLTDPAIGQFTSKRQSASEFVGTASALDLRTEDIVEQDVRSLGEELHRILGLYQQYGPRERIFRAGGAAGVEITKRFEKSRLQGKILLRLIANLQQINEQLQRQMATDMLSLLLNEILIQSGIVGPDTIYYAIQQVAKLSHYRAPLHEPDLPPMSAPPNVENHQMFQGTAPKGPNMGENMNEHLQVHTMAAADAKLMATWPAKSRELMQTHIQETIKMQQAKALLQQQRAAMAASMAQEMAAKGIRPGQSGGQRPGENTGPGTKDEGVRDAGAGKSAPQPGAQ